MRAQAPEADHMLAFLDHADGQLCCPETMLERCSRQRGSGDDRMPFDDLDIQTSRNVRRRYAPNKF